MVPHEPKDVPVYPEYLPQAAEAMLLSDSDPEPQGDDLRQARELALLFCKSEEATETFIALCDVAARDLLMPYGDLLMALSILLRIKRTLNGAEIGKSMWDMEAQKALVVERRRRTEWRKCELAAEPLSRDHILPQIRCPNQRHQRSAGTADVIGPMILKGPDVQIVGATIVIGVVQQQTHSSEKSDDCAVINYLRTPDYHSSFQSARL
jgi:hypothetical protein